MMIILIVLRWWIGYVFSLDYPPWLKIKNKKPITKLAHNFDITFFEVQKGDVEIVIVRGERS